MPDQVNFRTHYVADPASLSTFLSHLGDNREVYFDLEADNMYHFRPAVSLLQFCIGQDCYVLDMLAPLPLAPLFSVLRGRTFIIHGCDYDLRMLHRFYNFIPDAVFDTMIAARLLGREQFGLAALVRDFFGVELEKQYQKADWSKRPLEPELIAYAAGDPFYLPEIHARLRSELEALGRVEWHREHCDLIRWEAAQEPAAADPDREWRLKGSNRLQPRQLCALRSLWKWREGVASERNLPRFKVMNNDMMLDTAAAIPPWPDEPIHWNHLPLRVRSAFRDAAFMALREGLSLPPEAWPGKPEFQRAEYRPPDPRILDTLLQARDAVAETLNLSPPLLANREAVASIASTRARTAENISAVSGLMRWQVELLAPAFAEVWERRRR